MKKIILVLLIAICFNNIDAQTWRQYNLQTGQITEIPFSNISTANSDFKNGNKGALSNNFSSDTSRAFFPLDIINDSYANPWRVIVKFNDVTGILIDPYHVLTAGHAIEFNPYYQNVKFIPGYENGETPYSYAYAEYFYLLSDFCPGTSKDYAIIKLDRPLGAISGWYGYGYNNDDSYFLNRTFNNPSYPSEYPFTGDYMFNWKGMFDNIGTEYLLSSRVGAGGMSGSPAYTCVNGENVVFGLVTNLGLKFNRITSLKYDAINKVIDHNTPSQFDLIPLNVSASPQLMKTGNPLESLSFILHNYSTENKNNANITVNVYLSTDQQITASDELIATYNYQKSFAAKSSELIIENNNLPVLNKPVGDYWVGIIVSGDNNVNNNTTQEINTASITITNNNYVTVKGRVISTQSNSGVFGVNLNGFQYPVKTDYNGNYETQVPGGWSGTVSLAKSGYDFDIPSTTYSNLTQNTTTNYNSTKKTVTVSGLVKSPIAQVPVSNVKLLGLVGEPLTGTNGSYSVNVYYGWTGTIYPVKQNNWNFEPYMSKISSISSNTSSYFKSGFYISGSCNTNNGNPIPDVALNGLPLNILTDVNGEYRIFLDSGWTGTVTPVKNNLVFSPSSRSYENLYCSNEGEDYVENSAVILNLKVLLAGAVSENTDTMRTALNYKNYLPSRPPDTISGNVEPFVYLRKSNDYVSLKFFQSHRDIVDWVIIEIRSSKNLVLPVDTIAAFIRKDGRILSLSGDTTIKLDASITADNYFVIIRHRNHLSVMSANPIFLSSYSELYDFTTGSDKYFRNDAEKLTNGKYAMYPGDADRNGIVNIEDYRLYQNLSVTAVVGYILADFNLDGILTGSDFNSFAPVNKKGTTTNVPNSTLIKYLKANK